MKRWHKVLFGLAAILFVTALAIWYIIPTFIFPVQEDFSSTPVWSPGQSVPSNPVAPVAGLPEVPKDCLPKAEPIIPTRFVIERMGINSHVLSLGSDPDSGAAAAPPDKDAWGVAWFNKGPKPGSAKGHVVMSGHTYHRGVAIGNKLYDQKTGIKAGDIIKVSDAKGKTMCYRYRESLKVLVSDYKKDENSKILYDDEGSPQIALVICWNYDWDAHKSKSRIILYADPVFPA